MFTLQAVKLNYNLLLKSNFYLTVQNDIVIVACMGTAMETEETLK